MQQPTTSMRCVGEYTLVEAFTTARILEHAGIATEMNRVGNTWLVLVPAEAYERASARI